MRTIRLFHWRASEAEALAAALGRAGFRVLYRAEAQAPSVRDIKESGVSAIVIDLSRLPSHGRNVAAWIRGTKSIRHIPLVFAGGEAAKVAAIRKEIPDAAYVSHARLADALRRVKAPKDPVVPRQMMQTDPNRTTAQKLGIREGTRVQLIDPPANYERVIGPIPAEAKMTEEPADASAITLWFAHEPGQFEAGLPARRGLAAKGRLWIVWRKGRQDGFNGDFVRQAALKVGLVDYKICSLDSAWSGMLFAVKKAKKAGV